MASVALRPSALNRGTSTVICWAFPFRAGRVAVLCERGHQSASPRFLAIAAGSMPSIFAMAD